MGPWQVSYLRSESFKLYFQLSLCHITWQITNIDFTIEILSTTRHFICNSASKYEGFYFYTSDLCKYIELHHLWQIHTSQVKWDGSNRNVVVGLKDHISNQLSSLPWAGHWTSSFQAHWLFGLNVNWFKWINFTEKTQRTQKDVTNFCEAKQGWIE